jgi:hypothetical protein
MLLKLQQQNNQTIKFTQIDSSLYGRVLNPTTIPKTYLILKNNGNLDQVADGKKSIIYSSQTALFNGTSIYCATALGSNNAGITFRPCNEKVVKNGGLQKKALF